MRRGPPGEPPLWNGVLAWWRRSSIVQILEVGILVVALLSGVIWLGRSIDFSFGPREGTLRVNVNNAPLQEIETIPQVGPALAQQIVAGRPYATVDELVRVKGIGPKSLEGIRPFVKVTGETEKID